MTSLAQMAAEELGVALESIDMVMGDTDRCPWDMGTFGSLTTRMFGPALRAAAAEARPVLLQLASEQLGVPKDRLVVENGVVSVKGEPSAQGELRRARARARRSRARWTRRRCCARSREFTVMGRSPQRLDGADKVTGRREVRRPTSACPACCYAQDPASARPRRDARQGRHVRRPRRRPASRSSTRTAWSPCCTPIPRRPRRPSARVKAEWTTPPPGADQDGIFDELLAKAPAPEVKETEGDVAAARAAAARRFEQHLPQGLRRPRADGAPRGARRRSRTARPRSGPRPRRRSRPRDRLAQVLGLDPKSVRVITPYVGGGFGGKSAGRQAEEAARLAKITGQAGAGGLDPRRGVLLRHLRSGLRS